MDQMEFSKKKGWFSKNYGLLLTVALDENTTLAAEFRHVKAAVIDWVAHRGKDCGHLQLTVVLTPEEVLANKAYVKQIYYEETELSPILQRLSFRVSFVDDNEQLIEEFVPTAPPLAQ